MIASAGIHLLLLSILLVGPAFLSRTPPIDDSPILEFIPLQTTDLKASGGGDSKVKDLPAALVEPPPQPKPPAPAPVPPAEKEKEVAPPEPVQKEPVKPAPVKKDPDSVEVSKTKAPKISLKVVKRPTTSRDQAKAQAEQQAKASAAERKRIAERFDRAISGVRGGLSGSTEVRLKGPGNGGIPYANFFDAVKSAYARDWRVPDGAADDSATAVASVVIARDGTVLSAKIIRSSGSAAVDRSVQITLDRVKYAAPLPDTEKSSQREVTINFNVKAAKLLLG